MYSGITNGLYRVTQLEKKSGLLSYSVALKDYGAGLRVGDSVSINGVCQPVVSCEERQTSFQAIDETLNKTTLSELQLNDLVSVERSLRVGDEMGGHDVYGHVFGTGTVEQKIIQPDSITLVIKCPIDWMKYILTKGFIAVDGSSLTVGETQPESGFFFLHLIPETIKRTLLGQKPIHSKVNLEFDHKTKTIVDTVERMMKTMLKT